MKKLINIMLYMSLASAINILILIMFDITISPFYVLGLYIFFSITYYLNYKMRTKK